MRLASILVVLAAACDDGWQEGDPIDRALSSWAIVPSLDEQRASITLEPRRIHRTERGVLTLGYSTVVAGPSIAVDLATGEPLATFATGATTTLVGATRAWVLQSATSYWQHTFPVSDPPRAPYTTAALIDRATLAVSPPAPLAPPIEQPVVIGDELFGLPAAGSSDIERELVVRRGDGVIHADRGFGAAWCTRGGGLVVAYQLAGGDLRLVSIRPDAPTTVATFPAARFDPAAIACNATATHAALVVADGVTVFDIANARIAARAPAARPPFAVRSDGTAVVATRIADRALVLADATGIAPVAPLEGTDTTGDAARAAPLLVNPDAPPAAVTGDLALFQLDDDLRVIDLATGRPGTALPRLGPRADYFFPFVARAWAAGGAFVVEQSSWLDTDYARHAGKLVVVDATTATELPMPPDLVHPSLGTIRNNRAFLRAEVGDDRTPMLFGFDLATRTLAVEHALPLCDDAAVLEVRGCR